MNIMELVNEYNCYNNKDKAKKLVGVTGSVALPELTLKTETINGSGILGDYEVSVPGNFESADVEISFSQLNEDIYSMCSDNYIDVTLRASVMMTDSATGVKGYVPFRAVIKGNVKTIAPGTLENGKAMNGRVTFSYTYIKYELNNVTMIELDKLNSVYKVKGVDQLAKAKKYS